MQRFTYRRRHRLTKDLEYDQVLRRGCRKPRGPLTYYILPNDLGHPRLGLSIGKRFGSAVQRNRLKRLLRDAFRTLQHDLPGAYDVVITTKPHAMMRLSDYQRLLLAAVQSGHARWERRAKREEER
ncbi:MAG: ribonuclease P protein component [Phycisphaerales bacterium]|nr:ribonuclease P protein component [Phycisphaerales bacterium]